MIFDIPGHRWVFVWTNCCRFVMSSMSRLWKVFVDEDIMQYADKVAVREAEMSSKWVNKHNLHNIKVDT